MCFNQPSGQQGQTTRLEIFPGPNSGGGSGQGDQPRPQTALPEGGSLTPSKAWVCQPRLPWQPPAAASGIRQAQEEAANTGWVTLRTEAWLDCAGKATGSGDGRGFDLGRSPTSFTSFPGAQPGDGMWVQACQAQWGWDEPGLRYLRIWGVGVGWLQGPQPFCVACLQGQPQALRGVGWGGTMRGRAHKGRRSRLGPRIRTGRGPSPAWVRAAPGIPGGPHPPPSAEPRGRREPPVPSYQATCHLPRALRCAPVTFCASNI